MVRPAAIPEKFQVLSAEHWEVLSSEFWVLSWQILNEECEMRNGEVLKKMWNEERGTRNEDWVTNRKVQSSGLVASRFTDSRVMRERTLVSW
jgi:hypothetical protein